MQKLYFYFILFTIFNKRIICFEYRTSYVQDLVNHINDLDANEIQKNTVAFNESIKKIYSTIENIKKNAPENYSHIIFYELITSERCLYYCDKIFQIFKKLDVNINSISNGKTLFSYYLDNVIENSDNRLRIVLQKFLKFGFDFNLKDINDRPLFWAIKNGKEIIVEQLLKYGTDPLLKNDKEQTALEFAEFILEKLESESNFNDFVNNATYTPQQMEIYNKAIPFRNIIELIKNKNELIINEFVYLMQCNNEKMLKIILTNCQIDIYANYKFDTELEEMNPFEYIRYKSAEKKKLGHKTDEKISILKVLIEKDDEERNKILNDLAIFPSVVNNIIRDYARQDLDN